MKDGTVVVHIDADLVVLVGSGEKGVLVAPSQHVQVLSQLNEAAFSTFLAALRRVVLDVQATFGSSGTTTTWIRPLVAKGHVSFRVIPTAKESSSARLPELMAKAEQLVQRIGGR